jgi:hypothetical protein
MDLLDILIVICMGMPSFLFYLKNQHLECIVGFLSFFVLKTVSCLKKDNKLLYSYGERGMRKKFGMNGSTQLEINNQLCTIKMGMLLQFNYDYLYEQ